MNLSSTTSSPSSSPGTDDLSLYVQVTADDHTTWLETLTHTLQTGAQPWQIQPGAPDASTVSPETSVMLLIGAMDNDRALHWNKTANAMSLPLLSVEPSNWFRLGPLVIPRQTPCLDCHRHMHDFFPHQLQLPTEATDNDSPADYTTAEREQFCQKIAEQLQRLHSDDRPQPGTSPLHQGYIQWFDRQSGNLKHHLRGARFPACPVCSAWAWHPIETTHRYGGHG